MREWPYAKEPFDTKLFVLLFIKRLWLVLSAAVVGALIVGVGYYLKKVTFGGPIEYEITTTYYIEYTNMNPETGELHNYINDATWKEWVVSDWFVDRTWQFATETGDIQDKYKISKEDLKTYFFGDLPSDVRIPISRVTTPYEDLTQVLNEALQKTYFVFAGEHEEMASIEIINETPIQEADKDVRLVRAIVLGAVVGGFIGAFVVMLQIIWDDTIVLPETFTYRYDIPMVGYCSKGKKECSDSILVNLDYLLPDKAQNVLLTMSEERPDKALLQQLGEERFVEVLCVSGLDAKEYEKLREADNVLLVVEAGVHHGKAIEHVLEDLKLQDCQVKAALLDKADGSLIRVYRLGTGKINCMVNRKE